MNTNIVYIKNFVFPCIIGVSTHERVTLKDICMSLELTVDDFSEAVETDDITKTICYYTISEKIKAHVADKPYKLLERLVEEIAAMILQDSRILAVTIEAEKQKYVPSIEAVGVKITRTK